MPEKTAQKLLTVTEASNRIGISPKTLRRWENKGKIESIRTIGGHRRFRDKDIDALKEGKTPSGNLLSIQDAAKRLGVSPKTLRRWENKGKINSTKTSGGHRRFTKKAIEAVKDTKYESVKPEGKKKETVESKIEIPPQQVVRIIPPPKEPLPLFVALLIFLAISLPLVGFAVSAEGLSNGIKTLSKLSKVQDLQVGEQELDNVLGVESEGGSAVTLAQVLDSNFNMSLQGYVEGSTLRSTTTNQPPFVVASSQRVVNLNTDLLDGSDWTDLPTLLTEASDNFSIGGDLTITGGDITLGTTSIFSGGDTAKINNIDDIDSTTEDTFESALDFLRSDTSDTYSSGTLSFSDGTFLDLSSIKHDDSASQGIKLPQNSSLTALSSGEGFIAWDTDDDQLQVFDGSSWAAIAGGGGSTDFSSITTGTNTSATMTVGSGASLTYSGSGTVNASSLNSIASGSFLRSDTSDSFSSGTLTIDSGATFNVAGSFQLSGTSVTSTATELNYLDGTTVSTGGVVFGNGTYLTEDATNLFWDDTNNLLGVGTNSPTSRLHITGAVTGKALTLFNETGGQNIITASASGATRMNLTNAGQLELLTDGSTAGLTAGAGEDLTLYHDGTDSFIINTTNDLFIAADNNSAGSQIQFGLENGTTALGYFITGTTNQGDFAVDTDTLYVDASADSVGVGTTSPGRDLHVKNDSSFVFLRLEAGGTDNVAGIDFFGRKDSTDKLGSIGYSHLSDTYQFNYAGNLNSAHLAIDLFGKVGIGTSDITSKFHVDGDVTGKALAIFNETGDQNILTASASGTTRFNLTNAGQLELPTDGSTAGLTIGAGQDLALYHDGTDSFITNITNDLFLAADDDSANSQLQFGLEDGTTVLGYFITGTTSQGDFAVDTDTLYVDASANEVGINQTNPRSDLHVHSSGINKVELRISNEHTTAADGLTLGFENDETAALRNIENTDFYIATNNTERVRIDSTGRFGIGTSPVGFLDVSGTVTGKALAMLNETGDQNILTASASGTTRMYLSNGGNLVIGTGTTAQHSINQDGSVVFNEQGNDADFRIEGDTEQNLFFVDASTNRVGFGTNSPGGIISALSRTSNSSVFAITNALSSSPLQIVNFKYNTGTNLGRIAGVEINSNSVFYLQGTATRPIAFGAGAASSPHMLIDTTGRVGVGNNSPISLLDVNGAVTGKALAIFNETGDQNILTASASGTTKFVIENSGDVGIGTSNPDARLRIEDSVSNTLLTLQNTNAGSSIGTYMNYYNDVGNQFQIGLNSSTHTSANNAFFWLYENNDIRFGTNNTERMRIDSDGNVGIGIDPLALLHLEKDDASTNTSIEMGRFQRTTSGTAAAGIGQYLSFYNETDDGTLMESGRLRFESHIVANGAEGDGATNNAAALIVHAERETWDDMIPVFGAYATGGERLLCMNGTDGAISNWDCFGMTIGSANAVDFKFDGKKRFFFDYGGDGADIVTMAAADIADELKIKTLGSKPIYFDASNDGTDLYIQSDGNIGMGTSSPTSKLHLEGAVTGKALAIFNETGNQDIFAASASGTPKFVIDNSGHVGIGTSTPSDPLNVHRSSQPSAGEGVIKFHADFFDDGAAWETADAYLLGPRNGTDQSDLFQLDVAGVTQFEIDNDGNVTGTYGDYHVASDISLKKDITNIDNALEKTLSLRGVNFKWKNEKFDNGELQIGLISQEVEKVVPEVVHTNPEGIKAVEYPFLAGLFVEAIKDLNTKVENIKLDSDGNLATNNNQVDTSTQLEQDLELLEEDVTSLETSVQDNTARIDELETKLTLLDSEILTSQNTATNSGELTFDAITTSSLTVLEDAVLGDTVVNGKLDVGILSFDNLTGEINAIGTLKLQSLALDSVEFVGNTIEMDKVGNLHIKKGVIAGNDKIRGSEAVANGTTSLRVDKNWDETPVSVTVTPSYNTNVWITDKDEAGFTINFSSPPTKEENLDWLAIW